jgi:indole-3-glycerol phosphate synthase
MSDVLAQIIAHKRLEVAMATARRPLAVVQAEAQAAPPPRPFLASLRKDGARVIAECKKQSPSRGVMVPDYDPVRLALAYEAGGAAAISVLTDQKFFGGALSDMTRVRDAVRVPVLRKDFVIDAYQIFEARAARADTFLLLSGVLSTVQPADVLPLGRALGMEALVESHSEAELAGALASSAKIFGVNNRDLKSFSVDLGVAKGLAARIRSAAPGAVLVCESGIKTASDVRDMRAAGYGAFLIGETLATAADPAACLRGLL